MTASRSVTSPPRLRASSASIMVGGRRRGSPPGGGRGSCCLRSATTCRRTTGSTTTRARRGRRRQFSPDRGARIVDDRRVAGEQAGEVDRSAKHRCVPDGYLLGVPEDLHHVGAGATEESFESQLERHRAGAAEAGTDEVDRHAPSWRRGAQLVEAASATASAALSTVSLAASAASFAASVAVSTLGWTLSLACRAVRSPATWPSWRRP